MKRKKNKKEIIRLCLGLADEEEKQKVYRSKESDEMLEKEWENALELRDQGESFDKNALFKKIQEKISNKETQTKHLSFSTFIRKYAAILIIGILIGSGTLYFGVIKPVIKSDLAWLEFSNSKREKMELVLPDGSKVTLNTKSTIKYPKKFTKSNRTVEFVGEAFFDVVRDTTKPFIVKTSDVEIEVLGTNFNVMAYPDDKTIETTLVTGKVKIKRLNPSTNKTQSVILSPDHKAIFYKTEERFILDKTNVEIATSWTLGKLIFDNEPFESLVKKLERWYNVRIILSDDLNNKYRYTLSIDSEKIEEVLEMIKKTSPVNYTIANGEIIFYSAK
jgi:ferric-dicitrate binding protein FerR (iron transport regulator)